MNGLILMGFRRETSCDVSYGQAADDPENFIFMFSGHIKRPAEGLGQGRHHIGTAAFIKSYGNMSIPVGRDGDRGIFFISQIDLLPGSVNLPGISHQFLFPVGLAKDFQKGGGIFEMIFRDAIHAAYDGRQHRLQGRKTFIGPDPVTVISLIDLDEKGLLRDFIIHGSASFFLL